MVWRLEDPQGNESGKITWELVRWTRGRVLDVGCGRNKCFPHFIGLDSGIDIQLFGIDVKPDIWIGDACNLDLFGTAAYDAVYSSHLLEHIPFDKVSACLAEWWRVLKVGGYLVLYLPHEDLYPKVGEPHANPDHKWNVSEDALVSAMQTVGSWDCRVLEQRNERMEYSLFAVFEKLAPLTSLEMAGKALEWRYSYRKPKPSKTAAVVRYGAFGDILQASSVFAGLKKEGYHVTVLCSPPGSDIIEHDPNVDDFFLQDVNQVPNAQLGLFWDWHQKKYDRWINLSESAEGTLLPIPGRFMHQAPPKLRHKMCNENYLWFQHATAGIAHRPAVKFYALPAETQWAQETRAKMGQFVIVWSLAGSSVHKVWPYVDQIVARLMIAFEDVHVVFVGGPAGVILEQGWFEPDENGQPKRADGQKIQTDRRVHPLCGDWSIRQTMTFALHADMVIGPETGVLNAVSHEPMPKVCFLSHSTVENLTRDWNNTKSLWARETHCPGRGQNEVAACHQLHYDWSHCKQASGEDGLPMGIAQCQAEITADMAYDAIAPLIKKRLK